MFSGRFYHPRGKAVPVSESAAWRRSSGTPGVPNLPEETTSGIPIEPFYGSPAPGEYPFTRGISAEGYRSRFWTMRQYAGFGSARESNARYRYLLGQGQTGLSVAFDLPTQMGYDSDDPLARGEVGKVGVAIATLDDLRVLTEGLPLDRISVSMTINATAAILMALYLAAARERGFDWKDLSGTVQNDLLKEYVARGTYIFPPRESLKITTDLFDFCGREVPRWNTISISGYHIREAGSTAVQEVAFTLANAIAYVEAALARGLAIDDFAPRLSFFFNAHANFFEEVAKFRAARSLWAGDRPRALRREGSEVVAAALPRPDRRLDADGAAARRQRGPRGAPGSVGGARRDAVAAHERARRGPGAPDRGRRPPGAADAAGHRLRERRRRRDRFRSAVPSSSRHGPTRSGRTRGS